MPGASLYNGPWKGCPHPPGKSQGRAGPGKEAQISAGALPAPGWGRPATSMDSGWFWHSAGCPDAAQPIASRWLRPGKPKVSVLAEQRCCCPPYPLHQCPISPADEEVLCVAQSQGSAAKQLKHDCKVSQGLCKLLALREVCLVPSTGEAQGTQPSAGPWWLSQDTTQHHGGLWCSSQHGLGQGIPWALCHRWHLMKRARRANLPRGALMWTGLFCFRLGPRCSSGALLQACVPLCAGDGLCVSIPMCFMLNPGIRLGVSVSVDVCRCEVCVGHGAGAPSSA